MFMKSSTLVVVKLYWAVQSGCKKPDLKTAVGLDSRGKHICLVLLIIWETLNSLLENYS